MRYMWIDRGTRAVFVEFTLYNANINLFVYVQFIAEFTELGGAFTWTDVQAFRPVISLGAMGAFSLACYVIYVIYILVTTVKTILKVKKLGCRGFVKDIWNFVDLLCTLLSYSLIIMFGFRMSYANRAMQMYYDELAIAVSKRKFINFQHIVIWDNIFNIFLAILIFIITLRVLKILGYNKKFSQVAHVITNASTELCGFAIVFGIIYTAYMCLGTLLFGSSLYEYKSLYATWGSLTNALLGRNTFDKLVAVSPPWAQFYYFTYVFCVLMTLATMFAAILNKSIAEVSEDTRKQTDTFGVTDVLFNSLKKAIGLVWKSGNAETNPTQRKSEFLFRFHFSLNNLCRL